MIKKIILLVALLMLTAVVGMLLYMFYMKSIYVPPEKILKTAVKKRQLAGKNYILCHSVKVTDFDWFCIKDEDGNELKEYCHIVGPDPFKTFAFSYDFEMADNIFIFYVKEKRRYYSEEILEDILEYVVTEWDVLYPVKHTEFWGFDLFKTSKYITENDIWAQSTITK